MRRVHCVQLHVNKYIQLSIHSVIIIRDGLSLATMEKCAGALRKSAAEY